MSATKPSTPSRAASEPGQSRAGALDRPEDPERRQHHADGELHRVLRDTRERRADGDADARDEHERGRGSERGERDRALRAAEGEDDEHDLEPLEQHALEGEREAVPVDPGALDVRRAACLRELAREDRVLVVQRLVARRAQDRLPQPLQAEDEQQRADHEPQRVDRDRRQRRAEHRHDHRERERRRAEPRERRPPARAPARPRGRSSAPPPSRRRWRGRRRGRGRRRRRSTAHLGPRVAAAADPASALAAAVATSRGYVSRPLNRSQALAPSGRSMMANVHCRPERPPPKT